MVMIQVFTLVGRVSVHGWRVHDAADGHHFGAMVPEEREEHGYRSVAAETKGAEPLLLGVCARSD